VKIEKNFILCYTFVDDKIKRRCVIMTLGQLLKEARIKKGITQEQVARYVGVHPGTVSRWEHNQLRNLRAPHLKKLSEVLEISVDDLYKHDINRPTQSTTIEGKLLMEQVEKKQKLRNELILAYFNNLSEEDKRTVEEILIELQPKHIERPISFVGNKIPRTVVKRRRNGCVIIRKKGGGNQ
jgi:transcriptional regulator with XRE-family HTH domain